MAAASDVASLTNAYRVSSARRAAILAALVAQYWRTRVDVDDPRSIERWLEIFIPRILAEREKGERFAKAFGKELRALEVPGAPRFEWPDAKALSADAVRTSLAVTGPVELRKKLDSFDKMTAPAVAKRLEISETTKISRDMLKTKARDEATTNVAGSVLRHTMNGGREVLVEGTKLDKVALGWVRVTKARPCYFCAMLASRGLEKGGWYDEDSFDSSDARFVGDGTAKVHDNCGCTMKPVYTLEGDPIVDRTREFEDLWLELAVGDLSGDLANFRKNYNERFKIA